MTLAVSFFIFVLIQKAVTPNQPNMKTIGFSVSFFCVLLSLIFCSASVTEAQQINFDETLDKSGFSIISETSQTIIIHHSIPAICFSKTNINGETMDNIKLAGLHLPNEPGKPNLPVLSSFLAIPDGAKVSFEIIGSRFEKFTNINLAPAPYFPLQPDMEQLKYFKDNDIYLNDEFYPQENVIISDLTQIRGIDAVMLALCPFLYNPLTKELIVYKSIRLKIKYNSENTLIVEDRLQNRWWDPLYKNIFLNHRSLPKLICNLQKPNMLDEEGAEYLIIRPNGIAFQQWADSIKNFRTAQGILSKVVSLEDIGGNDATLIENYINEAYNNWDIPPAAILLLGDYGTDEANSIISPIWDGYCVSDNIYADVNGNDLPDIILARMCAENEDHLETMVSKVLNYEKSPPTDPAFYNHPITSCNFVPAGYFQLLTESVAGFYENGLGKNTNRINAGPVPIPSEWSTAPYAFFIVEYFGPAGLGYIPSSPEEVNCDWNATTTDVVNGINNGAFMLLHRSQSYEQGWAEPPFTNNDVNSLNNTNLSFVWLADGLSGKFYSYDECLAEKFHRHKFNNTNAGALGVVAATEITYAFMNEVFTWGAWDNMWPDFIPESGTPIPSPGVYPAFAVASSKYTMEQTSWPISQNLKDLTYHVFHYFGDAFSTIYTELPQELNISHAFSLQTGDTSFEILAEEGSLIGLSVNKNLIGVAEGTGEPLEIQILPQTLPGELLITVTKQNFFRYENTVPVIDPTGFIEQNLNNEFIVFPNPSTGKISLWFEKINEVFDVTVINSFSYVVFEATHITSSTNHLFINLEGQLKGIYYIIIESGSGKTMKKIIIQ